MSDIKQLRIEKRLTQKDAADMIGISLRSYISYENDPKKEGSFKYGIIRRMLQDVNPIDEDHGILMLSDIQTKCKPILDKYNVSFCYVFGSYAKGKADQHSDVDILVSTETGGLRFYELVEEIRSSLNKRVDVLSADQLANNIELTKEILKDGVKIYG